MIAKMVKGRGFRGALEYNLSREGGYVIDSNMAGKTPRELAKEFGEIRKLRPTLKKAVLHVSLSAAPGERLTDEQWREIGRRYLRGMGFSDNQFVIVRHCDTGHEHIHIVVNRITHAGEVVSDGQDYKRQENIMREIEREYGLQRVAPSTEAERKAPTRGEIERAMRTGQPSTRDQLQKLCDAAAKGCRSFTEYVERLEVAGVEVVPTVQQGGARLSGIQYRLGGVTMKGSDLGRGYTAAGLQKRGVGYEQDRDLPTVERCRERGAVADRAERQGSAGDHRAVAAGYSDAGAGVGADAPHASRDEPEPRARAGDPTEQRGPADAGGRGGGSAGDRADRRGDWASRFRVASAAKRRAAADADGSVGERAVESGDASGAGGAEADRQSSGGVVRQSQYSGVRRSVSEQERQSARKVDPRPYLEGRDYRVKSEGRYLYARGPDGGRVYRLSRDRDTGDWLWCDRDGSHGGDLIDLVQQIDRASYSQAVQTLLGSSVPAATIAAPHHPQDTRLVLPSGHDLYRDAGRAYLRKRGIGDPIIRHAEAAGMLRYAYGCVMFVGYDSDGVPRSAFRRSTRADDPWSKRDLRGSDKRYPPILPGDPSWVWVVEGGVDALACHEITARASPYVSGLTAPTVIVSGGASVISFVDSPHVQALLRGAHKGVVIARDRDPDDAVRERTYAQHARQADRIAQIVGADRVVYWDPPPGAGKDLADYVLTLPAPGPSAAGAPDIDASDDDGCGIYDSPSC